ncbi:cadherin repeat domain-containing protein [Hoyosella rhizosphaerae]|uniref:Oxygenase n=1 Tax=Hoyosella rhizosphaerae TaxID=1755582 RepID=A0A916TZL3_9ACTN|nr:styrene monooxygenase/indole monooxygenase family protein [Hoyosella rhizosphaerae]MBN4927229.1 cadherin repeat domain-containing protein [Hoyosella rhizosphaerae]GGC52954.1 putative oxygenase [Hoyosella rhizosphaerae]
MTIEQRTVAVVGAGLAGSSAALGFVNAGFSVTLFSDRDLKSLRDDVPPTGTAVYFGKSREADATIIEDLYGAQSHTSGLSTRLHSGVGETSADVLEFDPSFGYVAQAVDVRLRSADRIARFIERGGTFVVQDVTRDDLGEIAGRHDLTVVATGKGGLASFFPVDEERTVYDKPQRTLLFAALGTNGEAPDFSYRGPGGREHNLFNLHTDFGEAWLGPYLHKDFGEAWGFIGFAKPGSPWESAFSSAIDAASAHKVVLELYREYFPKDAREVEKLRPIESDPHSWLRGAVTPTVRKAVGATDSGHPVLAIGDTAIAFDPVAGQGAQNAIIQVASLVAAARKHQGPFTAEWLGEQFELHWKSRGYAATEVTRLFLGDPKHAEHAQLLFAAAAVNDAVATALFLLLSEPDRFLALTSRDDVLAYITEAAGVSAEDVLAAFSPSEGFAESSLARAAS